MVEFKAKADAIIKERWGFEVEHIRAKQTAENVFYRLLIDRADVSPGPSSDGLGVSVDFRNAGFAPLYGDPDVTLRLVDGTGRAVRSCRMGHELASLSGGDHAGDVGTARATVSLKGLEDGTYGIFVDLAAGGGRTPILLANGQDREPGLGYLVGTVTLSTYGLLVLPATGGTGTGRAMAAGWMLSVLSGLALASHGAGWPVLRNDGDGRGPGRRRAEARRRRMLRGNGGTPAPFLPSP